MVVDSGQVGASLWPHNRLHHTNSHANTVPPMQKRLNELGYQQRLGRPLKWQTVFCFTYSIMSPVTAITGLYFQGLLYGGPVALIWGWVLTSIFTIAVGLAFSELCSAMPQSGGEAPDAPAGCISATVPDSDLPRGALQVCTSGEAAGSPASRPACWLPKTGALFSLQELHAGGEAWRILVVGDRLGGAPTACMPAHDHASKASDTSIASLQQPRLHFCLGHPRPGACMAAAALPALPLACFRKTNTCLRQVLHAGLFAADQPAGSARVCGRQ